MTITLNHTIVHARDKEAAARFFAQIFGLPFEGSGGHFAPVRVNDTLTLDFADEPGPIASQHYAFHVSDSEFDSILLRVKAAGTRDWQRPLEPCGREAQQLEWRARFLFQGSQRPCHRADDRAAVSAGEAVRVSRQSLYSGPS